MPRMSDLLKRMANTGAQRFAVREVFFRARTGQLRFIALHTAGLFDHEDILITVNRFSPFEEGDLRLYLSDDEIRKAPGWNAGAEAGRMSLEMWPPVLGGLSDGSASPFLFHAAMAEAEAAGEGAAAPDPRVDRLERAAHRLGAEVFGEAGPIGTLDDMVVSPVGYAITDLIISGRKVPYARLRHMAEEGAHIVVNLDEAGLEAMPGA